MFMNGDWAFIPNRASAERPIGDPFELQLPPGLFMNRGDVFPGEAGDESDAWPNREYHTACREESLPGGVFGVPVSIGMSKEGELSPEGLGRSGVWKYKNI